MNLLLSVDGGGGGVVKLPHVSGPHGREGGERGAHDCFNAVSLLLMTFVSLFKPGCLCTDKWVTDGPI